MSMASWDLLTNMGSSKAVAISAVVCVLVVFAGDASLVMAEDFIEQLEPVRQSTSVDLDVFITNNDNGAIYNSGLLDLNLDDLAECIANVNPDYSKEQVLGGITACIMPCPTGEVYNGWNAAKDVNGNFGLSHDGRNYNQWLSTQANPNLDTLALTISVPNEFLDIDGVGAAKEIVLGTDVVDSAFVGVMNALNSYSKSAYEYEVVNVSANGQVLVSGVGVAGLWPLVDFCVTNNSTETLDRFYLKADGVYGVRCDSGDWVGSVFGPAENIDVDGDGVYDRGVKLEPDAGGLGCGQSLEFRVNSAYGGSLGGSCALVCLDRNCVVDCNSVVSDGSIEGDINGDGYVDYYDMLTMAEDWLETGGDFKGDLNGDGAVNLLDYNKFADSWGFEPVIIDIDLEPEDFIEQLEPNHEARPDKVELGISITNNDNGAIYNSGLLDLNLDDLAECIANVNPDYTKEQVLGGITANVRAPPTGEVYTGWNAAKDVNGNFSLSNNDFWYDQWFCTQVNPNLDTLALTISVPNEFLDVDGVAGYDAESDARLELGRGIIDIGFVGYVGTGSVSKPAREYIVTQGSE